MKRLVSINIGPLQQKHGDREALAIAKRLGADAVDFDTFSKNWDYRVEGSVYAGSDEQIVAYFKDLAAYASSLGIIIGQTHGRIRLYSLDEEENRAVLENARRDCMAAAALGAPVVVMHGVTTGAMGPDAPREQMHELNLRAFTDILPYAKKYGVTIATETFGDSPSYGCCDFFGNIDEFLMTYNRICAVEDYRSIFKICMDTGHCNKATRFNNNPTAANAIRMLGANIAVLHLNDNDTLTDQHKIPMTGTIDWTDTLNALDEVGYQGIYNMEISPNHFGKGFMEEEYAFAIKVMKHTLALRYPDEV